MFEKETNKDCPAIAGHGDGLLQPKALETVILKGRQTLHWCWTLLNFLS